MKRFTLTGGLRYTFLRIRFLEMHLGPGAWTPNRNIVAPQTDDARWHELSPRSGLAVDVFGNGKTALKVNLNKYLTNMGTESLATDFNPTNLIVRTVTRSWTDSNRNFVPECDLTNTQANGECGRMSNTNFGLTRPGSTYDLDLVRGWGRRLYNWEFSAGVQHELMPRVSADVSYFRRWYGNFAVTDDRAVAASDFDRFSITARSG